MATEKFFIISDLVLLIFPKKGSQLLWNSIIVEGKSAKVY